MGFADEVAAETRKSGTSCLMCAHLDGLDPADADDIRAVMADRTVATEPIARALNNRGVNISSSAIRKHRTRCVIS